MANGHVTKIVVFTEDGRGIEIPRSSIKEMVLEISDSPTPSVSLNVAATYAIVVDIDRTEPNTFRIHAIRKGFDRDEIP